MGRGFSCTWLLDVKCPHKKCEHQKFLTRCKKCVHYGVYVREAEEKEEAFWEEEERIRRTGKWE